MNYINLMMWLKRYTGSDLTVINFHDMAVRKYPEARKYIHFEAVLTGSDLETLDRVYEIYLEDFRNEQERTK